MRAVRHCAFAMTSMLLGSVCCCSTVAFQTTSSLAERMKPRPFQQIGSTPFMRRCLPLSPLHASKKNLSASERERRDEENRRRGRKDEVIPGKTSAKAGAKDLALDPKATELEFLRQASKVEQEIYVYTEKGLESLKMLQLDEARAAFDRVFELKPNAYLWQAGIVLFYLGDLAAAADHFTKSALIFESRFGSPASEERIWRDACELKMLFCSMSRKERKTFQEDDGVSLLLDPIPETMPDDTSSMESRRVIRLARSLFAASLESDHATVLLSRARLNALSGAGDGGPRMDRKKWKLSSCFYLGLHYDVMGDVEESKKCMKLALQLCPSSGNADDIIHTLPLLHMSERDWFDDADFEEDLDLIDELSTGASGTSSVSEFSITPRSTSAWDANGRITPADPVIEATIKDGVGKMKLHQIQAALRLRGLKTMGSKEVLQEKLFNSLMEDANLDSGFAP